MVYYLNPNKQSTSSGGNFEVHSALCKHSPEDKTKLLFIGNFNSAHEAVISAKQTYLKLACDIDGCYFCCNDENTETHNRF